jgi:hypothetical protein
LLAAAARGIRGVAEMRDGGHLVHISDESAYGYVLGVEAALNLNPLARQLRTTTSFVEAEAIATALCGSTELVTRTPEGAASPRPNARKTICRHANEVQTPSD